jgi:hypothetical protein
MFKQVNVIRRLKISLKFLNFFVFFIECHFQKIHIQKLYENENIIYFFKLDKPPRPLDKKLLRFFEIF